MKPHYFDQGQADPDDFMLKACINQGYVPPTCLLNGAIVLAEVNAARVPCAGCEAPREKCHGSPRSLNAQS